jgi:hypothetical protein
LSTQAIKKQAKRHVVIQEANPATDLPACLGKVRFVSEEEALAQSSFRPYFCPWCDGYHTSAHGFKGSRRGR